MSNQLGIDTGGTYTDAVIIDAERNVIAKNKSLTTSYDLTIGIDNVLSNLPSELLASINLVALSTTLSTNSVVEGRGAPVAVLLPGYSEQQVQKSELPRILDRDFITILDGGHNAVGSELMPLDTALATQKILAQNDKVSAFAISSLFATRNPCHELALRQLVNELTGKPVTCGHELATSLGAPRRALTAALNARMILYIQTLLAAVEAILQRRNIQAPLMIVKGDGSLVNAKTAQQQPVATVLSGPAASVIGACALSGQRDAIVVDMGGTTTDIAVVTDGKPELCEDGACIGDWRPMVEAIRVFSIGLGGDSEVRFNGKLTLARRVVPLSLLAYQFPEVLAKLQRQLDAPPSPRNNRFALRLQHNQVLLGQLNETELRAWEALEKVPIELDSLIDCDRPMLRALATLERMGLVIYSGFTPSDATHVLNLSTHWEPRAAHLGVRLWARQMRHLYGCGNWHSDDVVSPCEQILAMVTREISQTLIKAGLNQHGKLLDSTARNLTQLLTNIVLDEAARPNATRAPAERTPEPLFQIKFAANYPLVAVGGPAHDYFPQVAEQLAMQLHLPHNAEIANAVGAVLCAVVQTAHVTVTQPQFGVFYLFHKQQPMIFENREIAIKKAIEIATQQAADMAEAAGASSIETRIQQHSNHIKHDIDGELFISTTITAVASGRPNCLA